jgi:hypothetical protein
MSKLTVGQKVFVEPIGNAARREKEIKEATITKIGNKYFELDKSWMGRFFIKHLSQDGKGFISDYQVWLSMDDYNAEEERIKTTAYLKEYFGQYGRAILNLDQLKRIKAVIEE